MSGSTPTILIVDDEHHNRKLLELLLQPEGYVTRSVASGEEALAAVAGSPPDLILLDIMMPGMDGYQVATALKADLATSNIPIVMVTALLDRDARLAGLQAGAEEFLTKPVDRAELWLRVRNLLRLKAYSDLLLSHGAILDRLIQARSADLKRFRASMEVSGDAILLVDRASMRYVDVNQTLCDLVGRTREEMLGLAPMDLFSADRETLERDYDALIADNTSSANRAEGVYRHKDGSLIPVETRRRALRTDDEWVIVCTARDVTERRKAEMALRASEREQRGLAQQLGIERSRLVDAQRVAKVGSWETDLATMSVIWSEETHRIHETDASTFHPTHQRFLDIVHPDDRAMVDKAFILSLERQDANVLEHRLLMPDGRITFVEERWQTVFDEQGKPVRAIGTTQDITERKRKSDELRRFSMAMDATADAIYLVDRSSMQFVHVNEAACRLQNETRAELLSREPHGLLSTSLADLEKAYDAIIESGVPAEPVEMLWARKDIPQVWVELRRHALHSVEGWTIVTLVRDVTERKAAEYRIAYLNRVYAVLSGINTLIVRVLDRGELFKEACRVAVEAGGFRMTWIGLVDPGAAKIVLVGSAGVDGVLLAGLNAFFASGEGAPGGNCAAARAIRDKKPVVIDDLQVNPNVVFGNRYAESGANSGVILPLVVGDEAVGVFALYASENEFFHATELKLLTELAGDIAFAIDHIDKQNRLDYLAYYDVLTGLANRRLFLERVAQYMRSATAGGHRLAVFLIDLERFKNINDSLGQIQGDALLRQVAQWLTQRTGDANLLARVGSDHFALVLPKVRQEGNLERLLEKTMEAFLEHPFRLNDAVFRVSAKVGAALFQNDGADADAILKNAEAALKKAKARGDHFVFHSQEMTASTAVKLALENQLREALEKEEFVLHYQPKVNLATGRVVSAEALIRWNDPRTGLVPPGRFIPILEDTGLINDVGRWALRKAIEDYLRWRTAGLPAVRIAVNVSSLQLRDRGFVGEIRQKIGIDSRAPAGLELEITESLIMEDVKHSIASLKAIRAMGVTIAVDDFGTGFSSLSYLAKLPVDTLKIDRSFVIDMTTSPEGLSLVSTIIKLAHSLKLMVVAEGVETEEQSQLLRLLNCNEMQGFLISTAVPAEDFEKRFLALPEPVVN